MSQPSATAEFDRVQREEAKGLLCELLRSFYHLGWCTGTGGGISMKVRGGYIMAPSSVAKERVRPTEVFELDTEFNTMNAHSVGALAISECAPLFEAIYRKFNAGAVIHTHSIPIVIATRRDPTAKAVVWEKLEMIKGINGASYPGRHAVPIIENTPHEGQLTDSLKAALEKLPEHAHAVFVRNHGAYIWGADVMQAKRHAEVYDWLCQFTHAESQDTASRAGRI